MDRITQRLWRGVEGPRQPLIYPCCSELFDHGHPTTGLCCDTHLRSRLQGKTLAAPVVVKLSQPVVFKPPDKVVILSGAPHRWIG